MRRLCFLLLLALPLEAQWQLQQSNTAASLRGIHSLGNGIAWASGSEGTILRTTDMGQHWQRCAIPPAAEHLDFRGIQAFDAQTAIVMSSGTGDLSRLYKTTDACQTWKLVFTNPDKEGFWDALSFSQDKAGSTERCFGQVIGDPVDGQFAAFVSVSCGDHWARQIRRFPAANPGEALFAASNSALLVRGPYLRTFVTGGSSGIRELTLWVNVDDVSDGQTDPLKVLPGAKPFRFVSREVNVGLVPSAHPSETAGAFSISCKGEPRRAAVIVGGDYKSPDRTSDTAWYQGRYMKWTHSDTPPHGYRSSVAYAPTHHAWITVGPNGTDLSTDNGRNWHPLKPGPNDAPDADRNWNALSLPFVVGPHGRIGLLNPTALAQP